MGVMGSGLGCIYWHNGIDCAELNDGEMSNFFFIFFGACGRRGSSPIKGQWALLKGPS